MVTVCRLRQLINKCPNVFPIYSESHGKLSESHDGREPLSQAQNAVSNWTVSLIVTRPYETDETKTRPYETKCARDETTHAHTKTTHARDETTRALKNWLIQFKQPTDARSRSLVNSVKD